MLKKPVRKPFSKGNYKKNDKVGKQAVLKYLHSIDIPAVENPDWGADLIVPGRDASYEVEVRRIWTDKWPHPTVHIPERKTKLMHKDNLVYAVVNTNLNRILFCRSEVIRQYKIVEVPNKSIEKGEFFFDVPIDKWTLREVSKITAEQLGKQRQKAHPKGTPRFFTDPNTEDIRGSLGELLFSSVYGFPVDTTIRPNGDGGIDFTTPIGIIDVKTALKPFNLLIKKKEINNPVEIYILAHDHGDGEASFVGWEYASVMKNCPFKDIGGFGIISYYKSARELHPMTEFNKLLEQGDKNG